MTQAEPLNGPRARVSCPTCTRTIFDGLVIKCRVVRVTPTAETEGKCQQCKTWVRLPLVYSGE